MTTPTTGGVEERSMMICTTATRALILALTFLSVFLLVSPLRAATDQEVMHLLGILADKIKALEAEFERWTAAGNPAANWETSPSGVELARLRNELTNVAEDAAQRGLIPRTPPPGPAPAGSRWVRVLRGGVWVWTLVKVLTSSDPAKAVLDVGIGMTCSYAGGVVGTVCFGPPGGVVGEIVGGALAPSAEQVIAGSGGREPNVKPAPPPPPPPAGACKWDGTFEGDDVAKEHITVTLTQNGTTVAGGWTFESTGVADVPKGETVTATILTATASTDGTLTGTWNQNKGYYKNGGSLKWAWKGNCDIFTWDPFWIEGITRQ
jgi:hypothetical protein